MVRLSSFVSLTLALSLAVRAIDGIPVSSKPPILACHVPLELKIFGDSSFQATSADLKSCTHIVFSSSNMLFLSSTNATLASIIISEKRSLELLKQQTPEATFSFSLRTNNNLVKPRNLKSIFNGQVAVYLLIEFLRMNKLKSFDIAWDTIQSTPNYTVPLKALKTALVKEGIELTTTIGVEVNRTNTTHIANIASIVDRIHLVPAFNRHYSGGLNPLITKEPEQAFDTLELNEGAFLRLFTTLNLSLKKIVVGLSLQSIIWKLGGGVTTGPTLNQNKAVLHLLPYYESCKIFSNSWQIPQQQPSSFYHLALAPTKDQWMIHIDPKTLGKRVDLLRQYGFAGITLYDYYQDDFAGVCNGGGKIYPLIHQAGLSIRNNNPDPFPEINLDAGLCLPFLGLTTECKGAFNFGTPKPNTVATESWTTSNLFTSTKQSTQTISQRASSSAVPLTASTVRSTSSSVAVTETKLPPTSATTQSIEYVLPESIVTTFRPSFDVATIDPITPEARIANHEHLVRTRRSSVSADELGTQPSNSFLDPPAIDLTQQNVETSSPSISSSSVDPSVVEALATSGPQETISSDFVGSQSSANVKANELLESDQSTQSTTTTVLPTTLLPLKTKMPLKTTASTVTTTEAIEATKEASEPTIQTSDAVTESSEDIISNTVTTTQHTEVITESTEPTTEATERTTEAITATSEPTAKPIEFIAEATSTTEATEPTTEAITATSEPTAKPTEFIAETTSTIEGTEPTSEATEPTREAILATSEPTAKPIEFIAEATSTTEATEPTTEVIERTTEAISATSEQTAKPTEFIAETTEQTTDANTASSEPTLKLTEVIAEANKQTAEAIKSTMIPTTEASIASSELSTQSTEVITEVTSTTEGIEPTTEGIEPTTEGIEPTTEGIEPTTEDTTSTTIPATEVITESSEPTIKPEEVIQESSPTSTIAMPTTEVLEAATVFSDLIEGTPAIEDEITLPSGQLSDETEETKSTFSSSDAPTTLPSDSSSLTEAWTESTTVEETDTTLQRHTTEKDRFKEILETAIELTEKSTTSKHEDPVPESTELVLGAGQESSLKETSLFSSENDNLAKTTSIEHTTSRDDLLVENNEAPLETVTDLSEAQDEGTTKKAVLSTESGSNDDHVASAEATTLSSSPPADVKEEVSTSSTEINEVSTLQVGIDLIHPKEAVPILTSETPSSSMFHSLSVLDSHSSTLDPTSESFTVSLETDLISKADSTSSSIVAEERPSEPSGLDVLISSTHMHVSTAEFLSSTPSPSLSAELTSDPTDSGTVLLSEESPTTSEQTPSKEFSMPVESTKEPLTIDFSEIESFEVNRDPASTVPPDHSSSSNESGESTEMQPSKVKLESSTSFTGLSLQTEDIKVSSTSPTTSAIDESEGSHHLGSSSESFVMVETTSEREMATGSTEKSDLLSELNTVVDSVVDSTGNSFTSEVPEVVSQEATFTVTTQPSISSEQSKPAELTSLGEEPSFTQSSSETSTFLAEFISSSQTPSAGSTEPEADKSIETTNLAVSLTEVIESVTFSSKQEDFSTSLDLTSQRDPEETESTTRTVSFSESSSLQEVEQSFTTSESVDSSSQKMESTSFLGEIGWSETTSNELESADLSQEQQSTTGSATMISHSESTTKELVISTTESSLTEEGSTTPETLLPSDKFQVEETTLGFLNATDRQYLSETTTEKLALTSETLLISTTTETLLPSDKFQEEEATPGFLNATDRQYLSETTTEELALTSKTLLISTTPETLLPSDKFQEEETTHGFLNATDRQYLSETTTEELALTSETLLISTTPETLLPSDKFQEEEATPGFLNATDRQYLSETTTEELALTSKTLLISTTPETLLPSDKFQEEETTPGFLNATDRQYLSETTTEELALSSETLLVSDIESSSGQPHLWSTVSVEDVFETTVVDDMAFNVPFTGESSGEKTPDNISDLEENLEFDSSTMSNSTLVDGVPETTVVYDLESNLTFSGESSLETTSDGAFELTENLITSTSMSLIDNVGFDLSQDLTTEIISTKETSSEISSSSTTINFMSSSDLSTADALTDGITETSSTVETTSIWIGTTDLDQPTLTNEESLTSSISESVSFASTSFFPQSASDSSATSSSTISSATSDSVTVTPPPSKFTASFSTTPLPIVSSTSVQSNLTTAWSLLTSRTTARPDVSFEHGNPTPGRPFEPTKKDEKLEKSTTLAVSNTISPDQFETRPTWLATRPASTSVPVSTASRLTTTTIRPTPSAAAQTASSKTSSGNFYQTRPAWLQTTDQSTTMREEYDASHQDPLDKLDTTEFLCDQKISKICARLLESLKSVAGFSVDDLASHSAVQQLSDEVLTDSKVDLTLNVEQRIGDSVPLIRRPLDPLNQNSKVSAICEAAGNSVLLQSIFCPNPPLSAEDKNHFPSLIKQIQHLAPAIIANLTAAMNLAQHDRNSTLANNHPSTPISDDLHLTTTSLPELNVTMYADLVSNWSFDSNSTDAHVQLLMADLSKKLQGLHGDFISAIDSLNLTVPVDFLDNLLGETSNNVDETVKEFDKESHTTEQTTKASPTTLDYEETNILNKNFWKSHRRSPVKSLERQAGPALQNIPAIGQHWKSTAIGSASPKFSLSVKAVKRVL